MEKKIEETSAIIMRQLLNPDAIVPPVQIETQKQNDDHPSSSEAQIQEKQCETQSVSQNSINSNKNKKKLRSDEIEEIHMRIMCHISNLNDGRKKNLINSSNSGYDSTIQHFVKQQRLEISRALRNMCTLNQTKESNDLINSIIPDIGIKIEDLSTDVIEKLSQTFGCDFNVDSLEAYETYSYSSYPTTYTGLEREEPQKITNTACEDVQPNNAANQCLPPNFTVTGGFSTRDEDDNTTIILDDDEEENKTEIVHHDLNLETNVHVNKESTDDYFGVSTIKKEAEEQIVTEYQVVSTDVDVKKEIIEEDVVYNSAIVEINEIEKEESVKSVEEKEELWEVSQSQSVKKNTNLPVATVEICKNDILRFDSFTQTDRYESTVTIDLLIEQNFKEKPSNLSEAVSRMVLIDQWVAKLTKYRQDMLSQFVSSKKEDDNIGSESVNKKRKFQEDSSIDTYLNDMRAMEDTDEESAEEITFDDIDYCTTDTAIEFEKINDVIVDVKNLEDKLVAGSDSGKIFIFDQKDGKLLQSLELPSRVPITSLLLVNEEYCTTNMYIGTFRDHLYVYNFHSYQFVKRITVGDSVLCMDHKWGYIFIGCAEGWLQRYYIEKGTMEYEEKFQEGDILALKATVEGPRRILIVATEDSPLCIRDALTGLRLRLVARLETYVAQTITLYRNLICCTTKEGQLLIMSFHKGAMIKSVKIPCVKGKTCVKLYRNVLFLSRNNIVHLYDLKQNRFIGEIAGPGGGILSLNVIRNQLVVGTNAAEFKAIPIDWNKFK